MRGATRDLTGQRFGNLLVVGIAPRQGAGSWWHCVCDCGKSCVKPGKELTKPSKRLWTHSCGCRPALTKSIQKRFYVEQRLDLVKKDQR